MRFIPTKVHGVLDYVMGLLLIASPWIFGFANNTAAMYVPVFLGIGVLLYSICTNYELGLFKALSMPAHLTIDLLGGILLAASPWVFGFSDYVYIPHLVLGALEIGASLFTSTVPFQSSNIRHRHREHAH